MREQKMRDAGILKEGIKTHFVLPLSLMRTGHIVNFLIRRQWETRH